MQKGVTTKSQVEAINANGRLVDRKAKEVEKTLSQVGAKELASQIQASLLQSNALGAHAVSTALAEDNYKEVSGGRGKATSSQSNKAVLQARQERAKALVASLPPRTK